MSGQPSSPVNPGGRAASKPAMQSRPIARIAAALSALTALLFAASALALAPGARAPELGLRDLSGNRVTIASLRGRVVVVDFAAKWCEPCAQALPAYEQLHQRYREQGVSFVGVAVDNQENDAREMVRRARVTFPVLWDAGGRTIAARYQPPRMPSTYVIDRAGIVRHVHAGYRAGDADRVEAEIRALLGRGP